MVPEPTWLERTVHPLKNDLRLAMAGPPQQFHNVPAGDILGQDTGVFAQILEPLRDRFGCSQCCGSGFVMRREALEAVGGWPLCNAGEDVVCSFVLFKAGWRTAHINEKLQSGVVAESLHAYVAQRMRWVSFSFWFDVRVGRADGCCRLWAISFLERDFASSSHSAERCPVVAQTPSVG